MTSFRQIEANRRNALRSTGPKTDEGKRQSRRNALRHGLTAETVIDGLEDREDYRAFEAAVVADYDARTAVERELVLRLASLLWRSRRIISIETDLLRIQSEFVHERRAALGDSRGKPVEDSDSRSRSPSFVYEPVPAGQSDQEYEVNESDQEYEAPSSMLPVSVRDLTYCFLRIGNLDSGAFERLGRF
jgi:hypothetical protein